MVESSNGPLDVSCVRTGDFLLTFENGLQPVSSISASTVWTSEAICVKPFWPYHVPEGVLGNTTPVVIMPENQVLFKSDILLNETGNAHALVPITALEGYCGIRRLIPIKRVLSYKIKFAQNDLLVLNGGAVLSCMMDMDFLNEIIHPSQIYPFLEIKETRALLERIKNPVEYPGQFINSKMPPRAALVSNFPK